MKFAIVIVFFFHYRGPVQPCRRVTQGVRLQPCNVHVVSADSEDAAVTADDRAAHVILALDKQSTAWLVKEYLRPSEVTGAGASMFGVYHGGGVGFDECEKRIRQIGFRHDG